MPIFDFRANGKIYSFRAPEGTDPQTLLPYVQQQIAEEQKQAGFWKSIGEGATTLGALPAAGKFGLTNTPESRQELLAAQESDRAKTSWADVKDIPSFVDWAKQTAGTSMGYLVAPGAAATAARFALKAPGPAKAVGLGVLGAQYLTENLGRQAGEQQLAEQEGRPVNPASIGRAALAAAGQTGLDVVGFKFFAPLFTRFPFLKNLTSGDKVAVDAIQDAIAKGAITYSEGVAKGIGKGIAFEVPQEIAQQALERFQAGLSLTDESARREYGEAAAGAVLLGGGLGGLSGAVDTHYAHEGASDARKKLIEDQKRAQAEARRAATTAGVTTEAEMAAATGATGATTGTGVPTKATTDAARKLKQDAAKNEQFQLMVEGAQGAVNPDVDGRFDEELPDSFADTRRKRTELGEKIYQALIKHVGDGDEFESKGIGRTLVKELGQDWNKVLKPAFDKLVRDGYISDKNAEAGTRKLLRSAVKPQQEQGSTDATERTTTPPPDTNAAGTGAGVSVQERDAAERSADQAQPDGVGGPDLSVGRPDERKVGDDAALTPDRPLMATESRVDPELQAIYSHEPDYVPAPGGFIGPTIPMTEAERAQLEQAPNVAPSWPEQRIQEPEPKIEPTRESQSVLAEIQSLRGRIPETPDTLMARNRLRVLEEKVSRNESMSPRDVTDLSKLMERFAKEELDAGTPREDLLPLLDADERATGQSREYVQDTDANGNPVVDKFGDPKMVPTPTKWATILKRLSGSENPLVRSLSNLLRYTQTISTDASEEALLPQDVEAIAELQQQGRLLNTEKETEAIRRRRRQLVPVLDENGKPVLDKDGKPVTKLGPYPKYGHPYLSKPHFNIAGRKADQFRSIDAFRPSLVLEGSEKFGNPEVIERLKREGKVAEYDPKTNTIAFTKEGLTDKIILHELLHAFTVAVLRQYETNPDKLTPEQHRAAKQIFRVMDIAKKSGLAGRYPTAFESVYEFVSHAMTEPKLQQDLMKLQAPKVFTDLPSGVKKNVKEQIQGGNFINAAKSLWNVFTRAVARLLNPGTEPEGNAMLELSEAVGHILTVPKALKGQWGRGMKPLAARNTPAAQRLRPSVQPVQTADETYDLSQAHLEQTHNPRDWKDALVFYGTKHAGLEAIIRRFQNDRRPLKLLQDTLWMAGALVTGKNNIYDILTLSSQVAHWAMSEHLMEPMNRLNSAVARAAEAMGVDSKRALAIISEGMTAMHERERRHDKYLRYVPLNNQQDSKFAIEQAFGKAEKTAHEHREQIYTLLARREALPDHIDKLGGEAYLHRMLEDIVAQYRDTEGGTNFSMNADMKADPSILDEQNDLYAVLGSYHPDTLKQLRENYQSLKNQHDEISAVEDALQELNEKTIFLNKESNYWTDQVDRFRKFYGWQYYVPFKGKPDFEENSEDAVFERFTHRTGGGYEFIETQEGFVGRESKVDNVVLQTMVDAAKSALRYGRKDVAPALKSLIESKYVYGLTGDYGKLKAQRIITFEERYNNAKTAQEKLAGDNIVLNYLKNGDIEVLSVDRGHRQYLESIRRAYREPTPLINFMNGVTGFIGHMHTRYNPSFAPYNFVRDALTNAFNIGATFGPVKSAQYLSAIAKRIVGGGMGAARKISWLYHNGRIAELEDYAKENKFAAEIYDYLRTGGRVAYIMGVAHKAHLASLMKDVGESDFQKHRAAFNKYVDVWADLFEFTSRASAYAIFKEHYMSEEGGGLSEDAAKQKAAADAKNLANFEQIGTRGREAGALFMFFRPAATGAVVAIDSVKHVFLSEQTLLEQLPQALADNDAAKLKLIESHRERKKNALMMLGSLAGAGFSIYMMAWLAGQDDDELDEFGRNRVLTDNMEIWTRNVRLPLKLFGSENDGFLQIPWGFGLGAVAATGAQIAATAMGRQSFWDMSANVINISLDSYVPIPVSRINPIENPHTWIIDSLAPSVARPLVEFTMNMDGLGRVIYNNRITKYGDAAMGSANVPEGYHKTARMIRDLTNGEANVQPNTLYFWANNYIDGVARLVQSVYSAGLTVSGQKEFDAKTDLVAVSSFVGRASNIDSRQFASIQKQIEEKDKVLKQFQNRPEQRQRYLERDPYAALAVYMFRQIEGGLLRDIRQATNEVKASDTYTPAQRKYVVDQLNLRQNAIKHLAIQRFKQLGIEP